MAVPIWRNHAWLRSDTEQGSEYPAQHAAASPIWRPAQGHARTARQAAAHGLPPMWPGHAHQRRRRAAPQHVRGQGTGPARRPAHLPPLQPIHRGPQPAPASQAARSQPQVQSPGSDCLRRTAPGAAASAASQPPARASMPTSAPAAAAGSPAGCGRTSAASAWCAVRGAAEDRDLTQLRMPGFPGCTAAGRGTP